MHLAVFKYLTLQCTVVDINFTKYISNTQAYVLLQKWVAYLQNKLNHHKCKVGIWLQTLVRIHSQLNFTIPWSSSGRCHTDTAECDQVNTPCAMMVAMAACTDIGMRRVATSAGFIAASQCSTWNNHDVMQKQNSTHTLTVFQRCKVAAILKPLTTL